jgi:hypothetical protein
MMGSSAIAGKSHLVEARPQVASDVVSRGSRVGKAALAFAALSAIALVVMWLSGLAGIEGAREGEDGPIIFSVLWVSFLLGGVLALVLGIVALVSGRHRGAATQRPAAIAVAYAVIAVLLVVFVL